LHKALQGSEVVGRLTETTIHGSFVLKVCSNVSKSRFLVPVMTGVGFVAFLNSRHTVGDSLLLVVGVEASGLRDPTSSPIISERFPGSSRSESLSATTFYVLFSHVSLSHTSWYQCTYTLVPYIQMESPPLLFKI